MSLEREFQLQQEVKSLRQQLAERDEQISDLTISSDTYFAERNSARDVWRRASKDRDELRQQLAAANASCKAKNDALSVAYSALNEIFGEYPLNRGLSHAVFTVGEALTATEPK